MVGITRDWSGMVGQKEMRKTESGKQKAESRKQKTEPRKCRVQISPRRPRPASVQAYNLHVFNDLGHFCEAYVCRSVISRCFLPPGDLEWKRTSVQAYPTNDCRGFCTFQ